MPGHVTQELGLVNHQPARVPQHPVRFPQEDPLIKGVEGHRDRHQIKGGGPEREFLCRRFHKAKVGEADACLAKHGR
ncbi:hypothetical protein QYS50_21205 (plasmid) [Deinococcus altitudinis]